MIYKYILNISTFLIPFLVSLFSFSHEPETSATGSSLVCDPMNDSLALVALYDATNGDTWTDNTNWKEPGMPISTWYGIQVNGDGCVTCIDLDGNPDCEKFWSIGNNLVGTIPSELGDLPELQYLSLANNDLSGAIPAAIGNLTNLTHLWLFQNQLDGQLPVTIGNLSFLENLNLRDNNLIDTLPSELGDLTSLEYLDLTVNEFEGNIPPELGNLSSIIEMNLSGINLEGTIPSELGALNTLERLFLNHNNLQGSIPVELGNLINLEWLYLNTNNLEGPIPPELGQLDSLTSLRLDFNDLSDNIPIEIGNLIRLTDLQLNSNGLTGDIPSEIGNLNNLTVLGLQYNDLTGAIPPEIGDIDSLENLWLFNNELTDPIPVELSNLINLGQLIISSNNLTGSIPPEFENLSNLVRLNLSANEITGNIPPELGNLIFLEALNLEFNDLEGPIPPEIGNLINLEDLIISSNDLSGSIPEQLGNLTNLTKFYLKNNQLEGCFPDEINIHCSMGPGPNTATDGYDLSNNPGLPWGGAMEMWCNGEPQIGVSCDDGNPGTIGDVINGDCECVGLCDPVSDSLILVVLYDATNGDSWTDNTNWKQPGMPISTWYGIEVNGDGCVTCIDLDGDVGCGFEWVGGNNLTGAIPSELGNLTALEHLSFYLNDISGSIPSELGSLSNLIRLQLDDNQLSGTIPSELGQLINLEWLFLDNNELDGSIPASMGDLNSLTILELGGNQLDGSIPSELGNLNNLITLRIGSNQLSGNIPPELGNLSNLQELVISSNFLNAPIPVELGNLLNLSILSITSNPIEGSIPDELGNLINLESLQLSGMELSGPIPSGLGNLVNLKFLRLYGNALSNEIPPELGNLSNLEWLGLYDNQLSGSIPPELGDLTNLTHFYLRDNQLEGCFPGALNIHCALGFDTNINTDGYDLTNNPGLPGGGDFETFCMTGEGGAVENSLSETLCAGESILVNGNTYDESNPTGMELIAMGAANGCDSIVQVDLSFISGNSFGFADAGMDTTLCEEGNSSSLSANLPTNTTGEWTSLSAATFDDAIDPTATVQNLESGLNQLIWSLSTNECPNYDIDTVAVFYDYVSFTLVDDSYTVFVDELLSGAVTSNDDLNELSGFEVNILFQPDEGILTLSIDGSFEYQPPASFVGATDFQYEICNPLCPDDCKVGFVEINVLMDTDPSSNIPDVITPNGDSFNEYLIIPKLIDNASNFPKNKLMIFNQWGSIVYEKSPYENDWNGVNQNGDELPQATYYYYFNDGAGEKVKGRVAILKE